MHWPLYYGNPVVVPAGLTASDFGSIDRGGGVAGETITRTGVDRSNHGTRRGRRVHQFQQPRRRIGEGAIPWRNFPSIGSIGPT